MFKVQKQYRHLNQFQRDALYQHCSAGIAVGKIADIIGVHKSTLYRELKRNKHPKHKVYLPDAAQKIALERRPRPGSKIEGSKQLQQLIREGIAMSISPEVIAGRLKREEFDQKISHESIYKWIYGEGKCWKLHKNLVRRKQKRGFRPSRKFGTSKIPDRTTIHERPEHPPDELGHLEMDTIHLSKGSESILTIYDKPTKMLFGAKMHTRTSQETIETAKTIMKILPKELRKTITCDNGMEFVNHAELKFAFGLKTYFCDPHSPWQKGGVENVNGIIRRYVPKGTKCHEVAAGRVQEIFHHINTIPRKSLDYRSPYEMFLQKLKGQETIFPLFKNSVALRL